MPSSARAAASRRESYGPHGGLVGHRGAARLGLRVDGQTGQAETLLGDLHQLVQGLADLRLARCALEERQGLSGHHREDGGDALDAELLHQHLVGVDIDLGEEETAVVFDGEPLEDGAQLLAGLAPLGPEVDDDRDLGGTLQDVAVEAGLVDVDDEIGGRDGAGAARTGRLGARLLRLRLGLLGRLHRGEVDDSAHGHVPWLHASILPRTPRECEKRPGNTGVRVVLVRRVPTRRGGRRSGTSGAHVLSLRVVA